MNKSKFAKLRKGAIAALCAVAVTCTGLAAACNGNGTGDGDNDKTSTPRKEDTQLLRNGNFEYFEVPENAVHLIKNVNNWSRSGDSSGTMSGIINTSESAWEKMTDSELKDKLDANNDLKPGDSDYKDKYVDYNGMDSGDILYVEPYAASLNDDKIGDDEHGYAKDTLILGGGKQAQRSYREFLGIEEGDNGELTFKGETVYFDEDSGDYYFDEDFTLPVRYAIIKNPETHLGSYDAEKGTLGSTAVLVDEDGNYYIDTNENGEVDVLEDESVGNVLMIHNYPTNSKYNGIYQYYSSQSITLEANTAAEISLWVKTSDLKFDKGYVLDGNEQDRGAYIEVTQSVASTTIDSFKIKAINTEKIIADNDDLGENESNGWLKYTVYVNACDFASSTVTIRLGLGSSEVNEKVTGYAFFDDVEVKKYIDLEDEDCTYSENVDKLQLDTDNASYCSLTSEGEDKIFYADRQVRGGENERFSARFHYLIDLASENYTKESQKTAINFDNSELTVSAALTTTEDSKGKIYASATTNEAKFVGFAKTDTETYLLPDTMKDEGGRPTFNDLIGIYGKDVTFSASDFNGTGDSDRGLNFEDLSPRLNGALTEENGLSAIERFCLKDSGSMLVMLSRYGAAYTSTLTSENLFTVEGNKSETSYKIISFWVKTSDMSGSTAATIKIVDIADDDNSATITVDSTNVKTNIGENKDIYSGWVQCFFFVNNDTEEDMTFKIEFSFGNTNITSAATTTYNYGWAAMANIQSLDVTEDIFKITSTGTYSKTLTFSEESSKSHTVFDEATRMGNVKKEVGTPSSYYGVNGGNSYVTDKEFGDDYDKHNNYKDGIAGLINRDGFENYANWEEIARGFGATSMTSALEAWNSVFGEDCYQPLIIVDSLRTYYDRVTASEDYIKENLDEYFIKTEEGVFVSAAGTEYDENETYYSMSQVKNYGYIGNSQSVSANSYTTVSVRVMVTGNAVAWIYLVDPSSYDVLAFDMPEYSYYYDNKGNVLSEEYDDEWTDAEHRDAIVYKLRNDGLYDGEDGVYANLSNLVKKFKLSQFENNTLFYEKTEDGSKLVSYDDLKDGVIYYTDEQCTKIANHYLCAESGNKVGESVYEYDAETETYYYLVKSGDKKVRSVEVKDFDSKYARYDTSERVAPEYAVEVGNTDGKWVTVNFVIHTGNEAKEYRLELWSGKREETGVDDEVGGAVAFDNSNFNVTGSNYSTILGDYENRIKDVYIQLIADADESVLTSKKLSELNVSELKAMVEELEIDESTVAEAFKNANLDENYSADYYTFSWYDSAQYVPFNLETAEAGQTGYNYSANSYSETLVYFSTRDYSDNSYNVFVDYSAIEQTISINSNNDNSSNDDGNNTSDDGEFDWLLITSIILFAVLVFVLLAILVRHLWKNVSKKRAQKQMKKNNYKQRERYIRKLGLVKAAPAEEATPSTEEDPVEEAPAEEAPVEETPVEEAPAEETPAEDTPAEGENKDE